MDNAGPSIIGIWRSLDDERSELFLRPFLDHRSVGIIRRVEVCLKISKHGINVMLQRKVLRQLIQRSRIFWSVDFLSRMALKRRELSLKFGLKFLFRLRKFLGLGDGLTKASPQPKVFRAQSIKFGARSSRRNFWRGFRVRKELSAVSLIEYPGLLLGLTRRHDDLRLTVRGHAMTFTPTDQLVLCGLGVLDAVGGPSIKIEWQFYLRLNALRRTSTPRASSGPESLAGRVDLMAS